MKRLAFGKTALIMAGAFALFWSFTEFVPYSLVYNATASVPKGVYLAKRTGLEPVPAGALACFPYVAPGWAEDRKYFPNGFRLCKHVAGRHPDQLVRKADQWWVTAANGESQRVGALAASDSKGRPLPQTALREGTLLSGTVIMAAPAHTNSLDSRYLGPIPESQLLYRIFPIFTW